jgi:hypothetical protein
MDALQKAQPIPTPGTEERSPYSGMAPPQGKSGSLADGNQQPIPPPLPCRSCTRRRPRPRAARCIDGTGADPAPAMPPPIPAQPPLPSPRAGGADADTAQCRRRPTPPRAAAASRCAGWTASAYRHRLPPRVAWTIATSAERTAWLERCCGPTQRVHEAHCRSDEGGIGWGPPDAPGADVGGPDSRVLDGGPSPGRGCCGPRRWITGTGGFRLKRLESAQKRYLNAIKTLTVTRTLMPGALAPAQSVKLFEESRRERA